jgi:L-threonine kinase
LIQAGSRAAEVDVPCTCGELVQGVLDGEPFLVSCPIDCYSRVKVELDRRASVCLAPPKALSAISAALALLEQPDRVSRLEVSCPLPPSKGFGTSTADVVGAIAATAAAVGVTITPAEVARLAVSIEPSDGTMFPGLAVFAHRSAIRGIVLGGAPPLLVAVLEFEGTVDTLDYNSRLDLGYLRAREGEYARALGLLRQGLEEERWELVGQAATLSARTNQRLLPKPELERAIQLGEEHGALGVCAAHSGTLLGVLFRPDCEHQTHELLASARDRLAGLENCWITRLVDGGPRIISVEGALESQVATIHRGIGTTETQRAQSSSN